MGSLAGRNKGWIRKITGLGVIPLLLAQVATDLFCAPPTKRFGSAIYRKMVWKELPAFLNGEKRITVVLAEGGGRPGRIGRDSGQWHPSRPRFHDYRRVALPDGFGRIGPQILSQRNPC